MLWAVGAAGTAPGGERSFLRDRRSNAGRAPSGPAAAVKNPFVAVPRSYEKGVWRGLVQKKAQLFDADAEAARG